MILMINVFIKKCFFFGCGNKNDNKLFEILEINV